MKKYFASVILIIAISSGLFAQPWLPKDSVSFLFIGDIMGHGPQIRAAFNDSSKTYDYSDVFKQVKPTIEAADFALANLEVTLAGPPFKGYPQFSSPDALAIACKESGIDALVTANNHSCDRGKQGIIRTIKTLDSLEIPHTGTYLDSSNRANNRFLVFEKGGIRLGVLNYTYGTNGLPAPYPTQVNRIDTALMKDDIEFANKKNLDKLLVFIHWGKEYKHQPSAEQDSVANFLYDQGVDIIIGAHPHVLQPMEYRCPTRNKKERLTVYSLGNFVSNQRTRARDGGAMFEFTLVKEEGVTKISSAGYHLIWVNRFKMSGKNHYEVLPCSTFEASNYKGLDSEAAKAMKIFVDDSRKLLDQGDCMIRELEAKTSSEGNQNGK